MVVAEDVARWMLEELKREGILEQEYAFFEIERRFGEGFTYINDRGGNSINAAVLRAFRKLSGDDVVWSRVSLYWRMRDPSDASGRSQYE
jgi:hypothetical protein